MSKQKQARRLEANEATAKLVGVRTSAQKARLVMDLIRGKTVEQAMTLLTFDRKKSSAFAKRLLQSAVANAENNHKLSVDQLVVAKAFADKGFVLKRGMAKGKGRWGKILKPTCSMTVVVAERAKAEKAAKTEKKTAKEGQA
jgi:large subunit ribosomal protein L22